MLTTADDERLAELAAGGSEQAFDVLVRRHEARPLMVSDEVGRSLGLTTPVARAAVSEARSAFEHSRAAREDDCAVIRAILSGPDRRRHRSRRVRGHLRACEPCRAWRPERRRLAFWPAPGLAWTLMQWVHGRFTAGSGAATAFRSTAVVVAVVSGTIALSGDHHAGHERAKPRATPAPAAVATFSTESTAQTITIPEPTRPVATATPVA